MGAACLVALALHLLIVKPMAINNARLMDDLDRRRKKLSGYARKGNQLRNERWIDHADDLAKRWESRRQACERFFKDQPVIRYELKDRKDEPIRSMADWVSEFRRRCQLLLKGLSEKNIMLGDKAFGFQEQAEEYKKRFPRADEQRKVTHSFFVYEEFAKILGLEKLMVASIDVVKIGDEAEQLLEPFAEVQQEGLLTTHPYYLVIRVEFERLQHVFRELLSSKRLSLSIERVRIDSAGGSGEEKSNLVKMQIAGRYVDMTREEQEKPD